MKSRAFLISHLLVSLVTTNQVVYANIFMPWTSPDHDTSDAVNPYVTKSRENNRIIGGDRVRSFLLMSMCNTFLRFNVHMIALTLVL